MDKTGLRQLVQRIVIRGKRHEIGLGSPELVTLATARLNARRNRQLAYEGQDPIQMRKIPRNIGRAIVTQKARFVQNSGTVAA